LLEPFPVVDDWQERFNVNNTAWLNGRKRAVAKYEERFGEVPPEGFRTLHVHDLRHTFGRRLRAAGVALETRQAILGHKSGSITTHYSAAELRELVEAMEFIATDNLRESHALTLLKRRAGSDGTP
jgi:integrase